ncbi:MAG: TIGR03435 family protein [Bryobacteraceae bacterium]|jgi:uncharacterized protein (TIGR03435 family)
MRLRIVIFLIVVSCTSFAQVQVNPHWAHAPEAQSTAPNHWSLNGATVRRAIAEIFEVTPVRVDFPAGLDDEKVYDFAVDLPPGGGNTTAFLQAAFEKQFGISITREKRMMDVYVLTAPNGPGKLIPSAPTETHSVRVRSGGLTAHAMGMPMLGQFLESPLVLNRPVVDETHLTGEYDIEGSMIRGGAIQTLQGFGLSVTPDRRTIEMIVIRSTR